MPLEPSEIAALPAAEREFVESLIEGRVYATCHVLDEYAAPLVQSYNRELAPSGESARLEAEGHAPNGWVDVVEIGPPTRRRVVPTVMG
ncbi:hypothetical protein AB0I28_15515 [Phytomonospora sp. NPDC050363]|uniref:hypothetical protein n=1 Tax=Phytomonospora sp. NPDC050363 TaxID=3155642 RepID=UPI00340E1906